MRETSLMYSTHWWKNPRHFALSFSIWNGNMSLTSQDVKKDQKKLHILWTYFLANISSRHFPEGSHQTMNQGQSIFIRSYALSIFRPSNQPWNKVQQWKPYLYWFFSSETQKDKQLKLIGWWEQSYREFLACCIAQMGLIIAQQYMHYSPQRSEIGRASLSHSQRKRSS